MLRFWCGRGRLDGRALRAGSRGMTGARRPPMVVAAAALVLTGAGLLIGLGVLRAGVPRLDHAVPPLARLAVGVGIALVAQLARLTIRSTPRPLAVAWGEAAIIVLCGILPLPWI